MTGAMSGPAAGAGGPAARARRPARQRSPRSGRRAGDSGTREAILDAARRRFAEHGYDGATIRGIAADAGVDPALVHHFYGTKERLFAASMRMPVVPSEVLSAALAAGPAGGDAGTVGQRMVDTVLTIWEQPEVHGVMLGLLRSAVTSDKAADLLREFLTDAILGPVSAIARADAPGEAAYRAGMVASQMLGVALSRYLIRLGPVASATPRDLAATLGPTVDRYLTGDIRAATPAP
jgi:AcrR family transcriptional regulator